MSMGAKCSLFCEKMNQELDIDLSEQVVDISSVNFAKCNVIFEDGSYEINFSCDQHMKSELELIEVCVNGKKVGIVDLSNDNNFIDGDVVYSKSILAKQPFLLHYDLVILSFRLLFYDGSSREYFSDFLLCVSRNQDDTLNIQKMLQELIAFDDSQIEDWMFFDSKSDTSISLCEGKWNKHAYKSLSSYIQLLEKVISCYKNNYSYFKMQGKHTLKRSQVMVSYENVKSISRNSFQWIMQNADQLSEVPCSSGIRYQGKIYLPYCMQTEINKKSWDVYENRVIIGFLYTVLLNAKQIYVEFDKDVLDEERIISTIQGRFLNEYCAPIITIKSLQVSFCRTVLDKLNKSIEMLQSLYNRYILLFDIVPSVLDSFPRKTSTFCEVKPYVQVYEIIVQWFRYGEYTLEKERLILQVKTLDKLFEYYCLLQLLKVLSNNGYHKADVRKPAYKYKYQLADTLYQNEKDVANTYLLCNNNIMVTLYYQPVISSVGFENNLTLYRTTKPPHGMPDYYTPDFVMKFSSVGYEEEYIIFDSKFSSRLNIKRYHMAEVIQKYSTELGVSTNIRAPKMVWILQGRIDSNENIIWRYHNSPLASLYQPVTSYGIVCVNTTAEISQKLWAEIKKNISFL